MLEKVRSYFSRLPEFSESDKLLIAISGGRDSVTLAHALHSLGFEIGLAHVNFKLRGAESDGDEAFLKLLAERMGVPLYTHVESPDEGKNVQMEARKIRYQFFDQVMSENEYPLLVTAHHEDDKLETTLLNLTRGTGIHGMKGLTSTNSTLRPLLNVSRAEIDEYAFQEGLEFREDSTNASDKYKRNRLRHNVLSELMKLESDTRSKLLTSIENLKNDAEAVEQMASSLLTVEFGQLKINLDDIPKNSASVWLYHAVRNLGFNRQQCEDLLRSRDSGAHVSSTKHRLHLHKNAVHVVPIQRSSFDDMTFHEIEDQVNQQASVRMKKSIPNEEFKRNNWTIEISLESLRFPITIRTVKEKDLFKPLGLSHEVKILDYLKDKGIPAFNRHYTPVACQADGSVFWIPGIQISEEVKLNTHDSDSLSISFTYI